MNKRDQKVRKNLRSRKGCSPILNIFVQNNDQIIPTTIMQQISSFNSLDCDCINRLNFNRGPSHEQNKKQMQNALNHLEGKRIENYFNNNVIEGYMCSEFQPHESKRDLQIKEQEQIFCDELLDNSRFRKDLDDFILN